MESLTGKAPLRLSTQILRGEEDPASSGQVTPALEQVRGPVEESGPIHGIGVASGSRQGLADSAPVPPLGCLEVGPLFHSDTHGLGISGALRFSCHLPKGRVGVTGEKGLPEAGQAMKARFVVASLAHLQVLGSGRWEIPPLAMDTPQMEVEFGNVSPQVARAAKGLLGQFQLTHLFQMPT